jgi:hypothetical protein
MKLVASTFRREVSANRLKEVFQAILCLHFIGVGARSLTEADEPLPESDCDVSIVIAATACAVASRLASRPSTA